MDLQKKEHEVEEQKNVEIHNLNMKIKTLNSKIEDSKSKYYELKKEIIELKIKTKEKSIKVNNLKSKRDDLNKIAHGNKLILAQICNNLLKILIKREMSLQSEINFYTKINLFKKRYEASKEAENLHEKIKNEFENSKITFEKIRTQTKEIQRLQEKINDYKNLVKNLNDKIKMLQKSQHKNENENKFQFKKNIQNDKKSKIINIKDKNVKNIKKEYDPTKHTSMRLSLRDLSILIENGSLKKNK